MKVVRHTPEQLILAHAPWLLGGALIVSIVAFSAAGLALIFDGEYRGLPTLGLGAGIPLLIFALAIKRDQAIFDRISGQVTLQRQSLTRYSRAVFPMSRIQGAELEEMADTARAVLIVQSETGLNTHPLVEAYRSGNGAHNAVRLINDWLEARRR